MTASLRSIFAACLTLWLAPATAQDLAVETIERSASSSVRASRDATFLVVRTPAEWVRAWATPFTNHEGEVNRLVFDAPLVDFGKFMVLGVILPSHSDSCTGVRIDSASSQAGEVIVTFYEEQFVDVLPDGSVRACAQSVTTAFHFVRTARSDLPVRFINVSAPGQAKALGGQNR